MADKPVKVEKFDLSGKEFTARTILNGGFMRGFMEMLPVIVLVIFVMMLFITARYTCQSQQAELARLKRELDEVRYAAMANSSQLVNFTRQTQIQKLVRERGLGLEVPKAPPIQIEKPKVEVQ